MRRFAPGFFLIFFAYGLLLLSAVSLIPLRLGELLQLAGEWPFQWSRLTAWIAQTPGAAPFAYVVQLPFTRFAHDSRYVVRIPSLLFALGCCCLFFALARQIPLRNFYLASMAFLLLPVHFFVAYQGRPYEQGLFLLLLATVLFFRLVENPGIGLGLFYTAVLTACIYTDPACYLPAAGYAIFLLGFAKGAAQRRALWFALPATVLPALLFAPFFYWAAAQRDPLWLSEKFPAYDQPLIALQALESLAPGRWSATLGIALAAILLLGLLAAMLTNLPLGFHSPGTPSPSTALLRRRIALFCLSGGVVVTVVTQLTINIWNHAPFAPTNLLWAVPSLVILFFGGLESLLKTSAANFVPFLGCVLIALCIPSDADYLLAPPPDLRDLATLVKPEITGDACVVFVSERQSRYFFALFDPDIEIHECWNFFHKRVILASHPFVRPDQQSNAESYFRALDFVETNRHSAAGGVILTMDQKR